MIKKLACLILILLADVLLSQTVRISGEVNDTLSGSNLPNAMITIARYRDSVLVDFKRSDNMGFFIFQDLPIDTYKVTISHKKFGDKLLFVIGSSNNLEFDFGRIIMPPKSSELEEVTIFAFKDPIYYRGDTLIYTADSFKVKPNASVEDLLKRLPGIRVAADGKITAQGKEVSKVLVDGDEFFGSDPTMATKNLAANSVESVQVYEKKNDDAASDESADETIKIMNLKLKDDAKKGYFGKITGASDAQKFYEGEILLNKFKNKQKISVFGLGSNTPKTGFGWGDLDKYGLDNESNFTWDEESNTYYSSNDNANGIPQTVNTGVYYSDKLGNKTKINSNYSYRNNIVRSYTEETNQYFLKDTSYITKNIDTTIRNNQSHNVNLYLEHKLDSLTTITWQPKLTYNLNDYKSAVNNSFNTTTDFKTRETKNENTNHNEGYDASSQFKISRNFKKKDRNITLNYNFKTSENNSLGKLITRNYFYTSSVFPLSDFDQQKDNHQSANNHEVRVSYFEPITKKIKFETIGEFKYENSANNKLSYNKYNNDYSLLDSVYSNDFVNERNQTQFRARFIYEVKKYRLSLGAKERRVYWVNTNHFTGNTLSREIYNFLPFFNYNYNFNQSTRLFFNYNANSQQPSVNQLQPLPNNSNQNFITLGNPNLKPTLDHQFNLNFNSYKPISGKYFWLGGNGRINQNAFSTSLTYDSLGRSISTPTNINGNYTANGWIGGNWPFLHRMLNVNISGNVSLYENHNIINNQNNTTRNNNYTGNGSVSFEMDKFYSELGGSYSYNIPYSTINSVTNKPYTSQSFNYNFKVELWKKLFIESDGNYTLNSKRTAGYNLHYFIINASIYKNFGKLENLIVAIKGYDLLKQNISLNRQVYNNVITDTKTNIITRYFLFSITYKLNSQKQKGGEDEED